MKIMAIMAEEAFQQSDSQQELFSEQLRIGKWDCRLGHNKEKGWFHTNGGSCDSENFPWEKL